MRRKTREVMVGAIGIGGDHPVRIQSMTNSSTHDVGSTVEQIMLLADAGCEIARVTVQGMKEALSCEAIKDQLLKRGYTIPVVADIHFFPAAAMQVIEFVDKVRINPGNFVDKRASFRTVEYDDDSYQKELDRLDEKFAPLVLKCKGLGRAMRIGANHGSLSDRIMNRFGATSQGMVESALEFADVCRKYDYHNFIFSMKASNPKVMIEAYRLLAFEMDKRGWDYPLHLGVTEAGSGLDGRVKSAIGIGTLLLEGLGDTIRISLTENPWEEIDPCQRLLSFIDKKRVSPVVRQRENRSFQVPPPLHPNGSVLLSVTPENVVGGDFSADAVVCEGDCEADVKVIDKTEWMEITDEDLQQWEELKDINPSGIFLSPVKNRLQTCYRFFNWMQENDIKTPVILAFDYDCDSEDLIIHAAAEMGSLLINGFGDGVLIRSSENLSVLQELSFSILQAVRMRSVKTEFISCPGCGRTLFDIQKVEKRIRKRMGHLPGVKIAVMGCIVNGPGEMADADFGYVGSGSGKIDLYRGKTCMEKNIDFNDAEDRLVELIKKEGKRK